MREGKRETGHRVTVPGDLIRKMRLREDDLQMVVRETFRFLLEREPASSILPAFSLDVVLAYFPEYEQELPTRLRASARRLTARGLLREPP